MSFFVLPRMALDIACDGRKGACACAVHAPQKIQHQEINTLSAPRKAPEDSSPGIWVSSTPPGQGR